MHQTNELQQTNQRFYDALWARTTLVPPDRFNTWPTVEALVAAAGARLEIAPGMRPRLPIEGTHFADISGPALTELAGQGGRCFRASVTALPFPDGHFDLVTALDVVEHVEDDGAALAEIRRVLAPNGTLLLSVPLHQANWSHFDKLVGHFRRYDPPQLESALATAGLRIERSAIYGMKPKSSWLVDFGMWHLEHMPRMAMWWYNRVFMPMGLKRQRELEFRDGLRVDAGIDEVLIQCRPVESAAAPASV